MSSGGLLALVIFAHVASATPAIEPHLRCEYTKVGPLNGLAPPETATFSVDVNHALNTMTLNGSEVLTRLEAPTPFSIRASNGRFDLQIWSDDGHTLFRATRADQVIRGHCEKARATLNGTNLSSTRSKVSSPTA